MTEVRHRKIEVLLDAPLIPRLADFAEAAGISGYTILPTLAGVGRQGAWSEDLVAGADTKVLFWTVTTEEKAMQFQLAVEPFLTSYKMVWVETHATVLRPQKF